MWHGRDNLQSLISMLAKIILAMSHSSSLKYWETDDHELCSCCVLIFVGKQAKTGAVNFNPRSVRISIHINKMFSQQNICISNSQIEMIT